MSKRFPKKLIRWYPKRPSMNDMPKLSSRYAYKANKLKILDEMSRDALYG